MSAVADNMLAHGKTTFTQLSQLRQLRRVLNAASRSRNFRHPAVTVRTPTAVFTYVSEYRPGLNRPCRTVWVSTRGGL